MDTFLKGITPSGIPASLPWLQIFLRWHTRIGQVITPRVITQVTGVGIWLCIVIDANKIDQTSVDQNRHQKHACIIAIWF